MQETLWRGLYYAGADVADEDWGAIVAVQAASAFMGGCMSGGITTPLDVVKTQLQASFSSSACMACLCFFLAVVVSRELVEASCHVVAVERDYQPVDTRCRVLLQSLSL